MRQIFYYKMRQLLQNATILLQNATIITKCDVCYKLRQYNVVAKTQPWTSVVGLGIPPLHDLSGASAPCPLSWEVRCSPNVLKKP